MADPTYGRDEISEARQELEAAYQLFNWATEPRYVDEAIRRIQAAESRLDNLTHAGPDPAEEVLPWLQRDGSSDR